MPAFVEAFDVKQGDQLYLPTDQQRANLVMSAA